MKAPIAGSGWQ
ncbi:hypothetical protein TSOC_006296 [Tetrabaena socialis]|uniref:Uncharacterized protein n=1 Tax=Tetrabaena socialis TaxID=47790 RepID=A0A2J8A430_9CHLO|nr:hypothetical protein TSOC_006296 [Tetrabaena socialis]|eukprot:PNH07258.1 hypothetical protein TSOC_006296 [Tetrabaena socialis]